MVVHALGTGGEAVSQLHTNVEHYFYKPYVVKPLGTSVRTKRERVDRTRGVVREWHKERTVAQRDGMCKKAQVYRYVVSVTHVYTNKLVWCMCGR